MDNLDFGWQFAFIVLLLDILHYFVVAAINYILVVSLGGVLKRISDQTSFGNKNNVLSYGLPFLTAALIIALIKIYGLGFLPSFYTWNSIFLDSDYYHLPGIYAYLIGMTGSSLTRFSYSNNWQIIGRLKTKRLIFNFIIWTTITLVITGLFRNILIIFLPEYIGFAIIYPLLIALSTYLFLKKRDFNQPTL